MSESNLEQPAAPAPEPIETAAVHTPESTPIVEPAAEPAAPAPEPSEAPAAEPEAKPHTETETLLEGAGKAEEKPAEPEKKAEPEAEKPAEEKPAEAKAEEAKADEPPAPRTYDAFTLPEGVSVDDKQLAAYTEIAGRHQLDQETAQSLLDMHTNTLKQYAEHLQAEQHRVFAETRRNWVTQVKADEELGGSGFETSMKAVARMRDMLVPADKRDAFNDMLRVTGAGDHPEFLRVLHNAARLFDEPAPPPPSAKPTRNGGVPGKATFRDSMYTHPSSQKAMGH